MDVVLPTELTSIAARFESVLRTNHVPTPSELTSLLQYTSHLNTIHDKMQVELESLQSQLSSLREKHDSLTAAAAPYDSFSSAFRRFPPELLQAIFVHCLPETRNAVMHASEAPLTLGRVCRRWRRIVENTPELWSRLHVVPPNISTTGNILDPVDAGGGDGTGNGEDGEAIHGSGPLTQEAHARAVNAARFACRREIVSWWLGRSGTCPLSLSFVWFGSEGDTEMRLCASLLDLFLPLARRWKRIEFQVPVKIFDFTGGGGNGGFASLKPEDVPLLQHFSLTDNRSTFSETEVPSSWPTSLAFLNSAGDDGTSDAPHLASLSLTFFSGGIRLPSIYCSSLQGLYLESNVGFFWATDDPEMWDTLAQCVALEWLTLKFPLSGVAPLHPSTLDGWNDGSEGGGRRRKKQRRVTTLPMLERLCLDGDQGLGGSFHVTRTMAGLRCPRLKVLEVYGRTNGSLLDDEVSNDVNGVGGAVSADPEEEESPGTHRRVSSLDEDAWPLPLTSHEPLHGLVHLLIQSGRPPLQKLTLESVNLVGQDILRSLRIVEGTLEELVVKDYTWRGGSGSASEEKNSGKMSAEDMLLFDLVAIPNDHGSPSSSSSSSATVIDSVVHPSRHRTLCPNLITFDASLTSAASQSLFCDFVESRYPNPPPGVKRLKRVRCGFTAKEDLGAKKRVERLKKLGKNRGQGGDEEEEDEEEDNLEQGMGQGYDEEAREPLDINLTVHVPMPDEIVPSPWTGIEGV